MDTGLCTVDSDASTVPETDSDASTIPETDIDDDDFGGEAKKPLTSLQTQKAQSENCEFEIIGISSDDDSDSQSIFPTQNSQATQRKDTGKFRTGEGSSSVKNLWRELNKEETKEKFARLINRASNLRKENSSISQTPRKTSCSNSTSQLASTKEELKSPVFRSRQSRLSLKRSDRQNKKNEEPDTDCILLSPQNIERTTHHNSSMEGNSTSSNDTIFLRDNNKETASSGASNINSPSLTHDLPISLNDSDDNIEPPHLTQYSKSSKSNFNKVLVSKDDLPHAVQCNVNSADTASEFPFSQMFTNDTQDPESSCQENINRCIDMLSSPEYEKEINDSVTTTSTFQTFPTVVVLSDDHSEQAIVKNEQDQEAHANCDAHYSVVDDIVHIFDSDDEELFLTQSVFTSPHKDKSAQGDQESGDESYLSDRETASESEETGRYFDTGGHYIDDRIDEAFSDDDICVASETEDVDKQSLPQSVSSAFLQETQEDDSSINECFFIETQVDQNVSKQNQAISGDTFLKETQLDSTVEDSEDTLNPFELATQNMDEQPEKDSMYQTCIKRKNSNDALLPKGRNIFDIVTKLNEANVYTCETQIDSTLRNNNDIYYSETQIDPALRNENEIFNSETQIDSALRNENDIFNSKTQMDSALRNENDIYNSATQIDSALRNENEIFNSATQIDSALRNENEIFNSATQIDSALRNENEIFNSATQIDSALRNEMDIFNSATQIDSALRNENDIFNSATQIDSALRNDNDIFNSATQIDSALRNDNDIFNSETQIDPALRNENDIYNSATQIDSALRNENDIFNSATQIDSALRNEMDIFNSATQIDSALRNENDIFNIETQIDSSLPHKIGKIKGDDLNLSIQQKKSNIHNLESNSSADECTIISDEDNLNDDKDIATDETDMDCMILKHQTSDTAVFDIETQVASTNEDGKDRSITSRREELMTPLKVKQTDSVKKVTRLILIPKKIPPSSDHKNSLQKVTNVAESVHSDFKTKMLTKNVSKKQNSDGKNHHNNKVLKRQYVEDSTGSKANDCCISNLTIPTEASTSNAKVKDHSNATTSLKSAPVICLVDCLKSDGSTKKKTLLLNKDLPEVVNKRNNNRFQASRSPKKDSLKKTILFTEPDSTTSDSKHLERSGDHLICKTTKSLLQRLDTKVRKSKSESKIHSGNPWLNANKRVSKPKSVRKRKNNTSSTGIDEAISAAKQQKLNRELTSRMLVKDQAANSSVHPQRQQSFEDVEMPCTQDIMALRLPVLNARLVVDKSKYLLDPSKLDRPALPEAADTTYIDTSNSIREKEQNISVTFDQRDSIGCKGIVKATHEQPSLDLSVTLSSSKHSTRVNGSESKLSEVSDNQSAKSQTAPDLPVSCQVKAPDLPVSCQVKAPDLPVSCQVKAPDLPVSCQVKSPDLPVFCQVKAPDLPVSCQVKTPDLLVSCQAKALDPRPTTAAVSTVPCPSKGLKAQCVSKGILKHHNKAADKKLTVNFKEPQNKIDTVTLIPSLKSHSVPLLKDMPKSNPQIIAKVTSCILKWNLDWLQTYDLRSKSPDIDRNLPPLLGSENDYSRLRIYFETFQEYLTITSKLLVLEVWEMVYKDWKEKRFRNTINVYISEKPYYKEKPSENNKEYSLLTLEIIGFVQDNEKHRVPSSGDLLRFKVWGHPKTSGQPKTLENKWNEQFALVKESKPIFNKDGKWLCENYSLFKNESAVQRNIYIFKLTLNIVYKVNICNVKLLEIEKISSLTTTLRQLKALSVLPDNTLCPHVLLPTDQKVFFSQHVNPGDLSSIMNSEQAQAVARIRHAVVTPEPKIFFLQGPAGTGKTHTIVQLIHQILVSTAFRARICLATPSNAAVDEIALRIIQFSNRLKEKKKSHISIVRVGKRDSSHPGVKPYHWEACVERYLSNEKAKHIPGNLQAEYQIYKDRINELTRDLKNPELPSVQKAKFKNDLAECEKKLKGIEKETPKKPTARERYNAKCHVLDNAHVICGTLSSFGVESLKEILSRSEEHRHKAQTFTCLIIDEATQAIEVDSLIPLQYKVNKLILVGDHKQLPATVVSQKANDLELSRSLFERMNLCFEKFHRNLPTQSPIMMLTRQYRMNPEILSLPNNLFYDGRLQTDESVTRRASVLTPYLVFDVEGGKELNASRSHSNVPEAICTAQLCQLIMIVLKESTATIGRHIGVICPYIDQRQTILEQLRQLKLDTIEVNTVDGYQGQEKNVIVMSCVRAQSNPTTIGFVADKRRMNVALTRAKNALYVLGHFETLKVNVLWAELQEDAAKRSTLVHIRKVKDFVNEAEKRLLKNNPRK